VTSLPTTITFAKKIATSPARVVSVTFGAKSSALSSGAKKALRAFALGLEGHSVICTGYAKGNAVLAKERARSVAQYLSSRTRVHLTLKSVTNVAIERVTVTTT
jgi:outer membrane protein OmpA-like peptidoglycan-associated protein